LYLAYYLLLILEKLQELHPPKELKAIDALLYRYIINLIYTKTQTFPSRIILK